MCGDFVLCADNDYMYLLHVSTPNKPRNGSLNIDTENNPRVLITPDFPAGHFQGSLLSSVSFKAVSFPSSTSRSASTQHADITYLQQHLGVPLDAYGKAAVMQLALGPSVVLYKQR